MSDLNQPAFSRRALGTALPGLTGLLLAVIAACGGGGGPSLPACRTGTVTASPTPRAEASLTLKVGSYEGTGSPQCIKGVGLDPVVVIVKGDTSELAVWRSRSMEGDSSADFANGQPNIIDAITSLDPDSFSLGRDPTVNAEGVKYYYVAFADSPDMKVGSYEGDGAEQRSVDGVGFKPALVFLKWDGLRSAVWRSTTQPEGLSSFFHGETDKPGFIRSFGPDGFQIGADPFVNYFDASRQEGGVYHYVAFRDVPGRLQIGTYIGDGGDDRDVTGIGFQPDYVWIKRSSAESSSAESAAVHRASSLAGDATLRFGNQANGSDEIQALLPDGLQVGADPAVNFDGDTYYYVAFKASSGP